MDHLSKVGTLGMGSRLKRLSDMFFSETKKIYKEKNIDFEPTWFPLFSLLAEKNLVSITEAAEYLNVTHPHISQMTKNLAKAKLIKFKKNTNDGRSRLMSLSEQGEVLVVKLKPIWAAILLSVSEVVDETNKNFLKDIEKIENSLNQKSLLQRVNEKIEVKIRNYSPTLKHYFEDLNREWLEKYFSVEPIDKEYFKNPESKIINKGGDIFFAESNGEIVGTCSLIKDGSEIELAKMAVRSDMQGRGIGNILITEAISRAKKMGYKKVFLVTSTKLIPAVKLYEKFGFKKISNGENSKFKRVDLVMEKKF